MDGIAIVVAFNILHHIGFVIEPTGKVAVAAPVVLRWGRRVMAAEVTPVQLQSLGVGRDASVLHMVVIVVVAASATIVHRRAAELVVYLLLPLRVRGDAPVLVVDVVVVLLPMRMSGDAVVRNDGGANCNRSTDVGQIALDVAAVVLGSFGGGPRHLPHAT